MRRASEKNRIGAVGGSLSEVLYEVGCVGLAIGIGIEWLCKRLGHQRVVAHHECDFRQETP